MTNSRDTRFQELYRQVHQIYQSAEGRKSALDHATLELQRIVESEADTKYKELLDVAIEKREMGFLVLSTPYVLGMWSDLLNGLEDLMDKGYGTFVDEQGYERNTQEAYCFFQIKAREWSSNKAQEYMLRAHYLLPIAPLAAINYLEKALNFPLLPLNIAEDIRNLMVFAQSLSHVKKTSNDSSNHLADRILEINEKIDLLISDQQGLQGELKNISVSLQENQSELQIILHQITKSLETHRLKSLEIVTVALDEGKVARQECLTLLDAIHKRLKSIKGNAGGMQTEIERIDGFISSAQLDAVHKLKVTVPLIPFFLDYEGELEIGTNIELRRLWEALIRKLAPNKSYELLYAESNFDNRHTQDLDQI